MIKTIYFDLFFTREENDFIRINKEVEKIIDIIKNRNDAKSVLKTHNLEGSEVLSIVTRIIDEIIKVYDGSNKDLAIQAGKYLLEFGMKSLPKSKNVQRQPAKIEKVQKEIRRRRDLNPRAALTAYTLSRGTSSAS